MESDARLEMLGGRRAGGAGGVGGVDGVGLSIYGQEVKMGKRISCRDGSREGAKEI